MRRLALSASGLGSIAALIVSSAAASGGAAATPPTARACPAVAIVDAALGGKFKSPTTSKTAYSKACMYAGGGLIPLKVEFQVDTAATFAASEKGAQAAGEAVVVPGLGQAAWASKAPGDVEVFDGHETIKILDPLTPTTKLEALARKLL